MFVYFNKFFYKLGNPIKEGEFIYDTITEEKYSLDEVLQKENERIKEKIIDDNLFLFGSINRVETVNLNNLSEFTEYIKIADLSERFSFIVNNTQYGQQSLISLLDDKLMQILKDKILDIKSNIKSFIFCYEHIVINFINNIITQKRYLFQSNLVNTVFLNFIQPNFLVITLFKDNYKYETMVMSLSSFDDILSENFNKDLNLFLSTHLSPIVIKKHKNILFLNNNIPFQYLENFKRFILKDYLEVYDDGEKYFVNIYEIKQKGILTLNSIIKELSKKDANIYDFYNLCFLYTFEFKQLLSKNLLNKWKIIDFFAMIMFIVIFCMYNYYHFKKKDVIKEANSLQTKIINLESEIKNYVTDNSKVLIPYNDRFNKNLLSLFKWLSLLKIEGLFLKNISYNSKHNNVYLYFERDKNSLIFINKDVLEKVIKKYLDYYIHSKKIVKKVRVTVINKASGVVSPVYKVILVLW